MYKIRKEVNLCAAHFLEGHPICGNMHGHNYKIFVHCARSNSEFDGKMVVDFSMEHLKKYDHGKVLNEYMEYPSAENFAKLIYDETPNCVKVEVYETEKCLAIYEPNDWRES